MSDTALTCTAQEAASLLGVSVNHIYDLVAEGALPKVPLPGKRVLIPRNVVLDLVANAAPVLPDGA